MLIERMRKRLAADRAIFIEPCLPSPAASLRPARIGFTKSSTTASGSWPALQAIHRYVIDTPALKTVTEEIRAVVGGLN